MNRVVITGNLTKDPDLRTTGSGKSVCSFTVAVNRWKGDADFFPVVTWDRQAEYCGEHLKKGSKVAVEGTLQNRSYETRDGSKRTITEIIANNVENMSVKFGDPVEDTTELPF